MDPAKYASSVLDSIKHGMDEEFKRFNDVYLKKLYESELPEEYSITDDSDEIKKECKIMCRYPLVIDILPTQNNPKSQRYYVHYTILAKDEYLIRIINRYIHDIGGGCRLDTNKVLITNKRILQLDCDNNFCTIINNKQLEIKDYQSSATFYLSYVASEHCLIKTQSYGGNMKIKCCDLNYSIPISIINLFVDLMDNDFTYHKYDLAKDCINKLFITIKKKENDLISAYEIKNKTLESEYEKKLEDKRKELDDAYKQKVSELENYYKIKEDLIKSLI